MMYGPMRIGGLASGMDIDQIVSDLMRAERMRVDKLYQQKQVMEWQKADYREIN
jgi:flagellar hook-associated protein 2